MSEPQTIRREFGPELASLLARAGGTVLDLGGFAHAELLAGAERLVGLVPSNGDASAAGPGAEALVGTVTDLGAVARGRRFDTIVAVGVLAALADLDGTVGAVGELLAPEGRLLFAEREPRHRALRRPPRTSPDADIRPALWAAGWSVIDSRWWTSRRAAVLSGVARRRVDSADARPTRS